MIPVSNAYKELVKSNIRPKCEPIIKVSGTDNTGKEIELIWRAKNIKDLTYKRSIDPVGRELPYMELTWTEIYTGKLNSESYPEKYNNIAKYMEVELSFVQDLGFYNTWKIIFNGGTTWKDLFLKPATWKQVKNGVSQETITMPKMFLSARPVIDGQTITWVARDLLSFINEVQTYSFGEENNQPPLKNAISFFMLNARGSFLNSKNLFDAYTETVTFLLNDNNIIENIDKRIICDGKYNDIIRNLASIYNYYFDFEENRAILKKFDPSVVSAHYDSKVLYGYPKIENATNISSYCFKHRIVESDIDNGYYIAPHKTYQHGEYIVGEYIFKGYGDVYKSEQDVQNEKLNFGTITKFYERVSPSPDDNKIYIVPINYTSQDNTINIDDVGEAFQEDNPTNPYDLESQVAISRKNFLQKYFSENLSLISFDALANPAIETDDVIEVETNLYDDLGNRITKKAIVVYSEIKYQGSLKQKIKAHEVDI